MKKIIIKTVMLFGSFSSFVKSEEFNINLLNQKIEILIENKIHLADNAIAYQERDLNPDFIAFKAFISSHWQQSLEKKNEWSGGEDGKRLIWVAMQHLPAESYMSAFEWMVNKLISNEFKKEDVVLFVRSSGLMSHFFADNYQHPRVISALNQLKPKVAEDAGLVEYIDDILSGEQKQGLDDYREAHQDIEEVPPVILLPDE